MVISFNERYLGQHSGDQFGLTLVHELLHPFVPDTRLPDNTADDHELVERLADEAWGEIRKAISTGS